MKKITKEGQDVFDLAINHFGDIDGLFDLLDANPTLSLTSDPTSGTEINIKEENIVNKKVASFYFGTKFVVINSGEPNLVAAVPFGIGTMSIGGSFIVS
jgi:hypothetical protein